MTADLVLLVNDIPDHVTRYQAALTRNGFRVHLARTGQQALEVAAATQPDCVVIDLRLSDMSGWDLCQQIKSGESKRTRVIVLTPDVSKVCATDSARVGCHAWLTHPPAPDALVDTVKHVLDMRIDEPASTEDALIGLTVCAGCGSDKVRPALRVGATQYYCCKACGFCWRVETLKN